MARLFKKILCPIDFDEQSIAALRFACNLAEDSDATVYVMHALSVTLPSPEYRLKPSPAAAEENTKREMEKIARKQLGRKVRHELVTRIGKPADAILKVAEDLDADLIVIATHGRKGVTRLFLGSVAERVIRASKRPVLMVPPGELAS
jgi:universal stress protein A